MDHHSRDQSENIKIAPKHKQRAMTIAITSPRNIDDPFGENQVPPLFPKAHSNFERMTTPRIDKAPDKWELLVEKIGSDFY